MKLESITKVSNIVFSNDINPFPQLLLLLIKYTGINNECTKRKLDNFACDPVSYGKWIVAINMLHDLAMSMLNYTLLLLLISVDYNLDCYNYMSTMNCNRFIIPISFVLQFKL